MIAVVGLGSPDAKFNPQEDVDEAKENIRAAIGSGVNAIRDLDTNIDLIEVDGVNDAGSAAEGATLANYAFDEYKEEPLRVRRFAIKLAQSDANLIDQFERGVLLANYQNKCRNLKEQPANMLTPTRFGEIAKQLCEPLGVKVQVHDREWAEKMKMGSFLSVSRGSDEPPKFVELHYQNGEQRKPIVFVGKGVCFDSGGISLKPGLGKCNRPFWLLIVSSENFLFKSKVANRLLSLPNSDVSQPWTRCEWTWAAQPTFSPRSPHWPS